MCRNTLTLQQANSDFEVHVAAEKLTSLQTLGQSLAGIDVDKLKDSLHAVQMFDLHLQHLLTDEHGLKSYVNSVNKIESDVSNLTATFNSNISQAPTSNSSIDKLSEQIIELQP